MEMRPPSRISRNCLKHPRGPSRFPSGTRQSSKESSRVSEARQPIFRIGAEIPARRAVGDDQVRDLLAAGGDRHAGDVGAGVRDEDLGAVDHPLAVATRPGSRWRRAMAGARLGQAKGGELLPARSGSSSASGPPSRRSRIGIVPRDVCAATVIATDESMPSALDRDRVGERVAARAAVLLGDRNAHEPELREASRRCRRESGARDRASATGAIRSSANARTVARRSSCSSERSRSMTRGDGRAP